MHIEFDILVAQLINFIIIFVLLKKFLWDFISKEIVQRKDMMKKLKNADEEYNEMLEEANKKADEIISQASQEKRTIIDEAKMLADKEWEKIISWARKQADNIIADAKAETKTLKRDLETSREQGVKDTVKIVVKRLLDEDVNLQDKYLSTLLKDLKS